MEMSPGLTSLHGPLQVVQHAVVVHPAEHLLLHQGELLPGGQLPLAGEAGEAGQVVHVALGPADPVRGVDVAAAARAPRAVPPARASHRCVITMNVIYFTAALHRTPTCDFIEILCVLRPENKRNLILFFCRIRPKIILNHIEFTSIFLYFIIIWFFFWVIFQGSSYKSKNKIIKDIHQVKMYYGYKKEL